MAQIFVVFSENLNLIYSACDCQAFFDSLLTKANLSNHSVVFRCQKHFNSVASISHKNIVQGNRCVYSKFKMAQELLYLLLILTVIIIVIGLVQALQSRTCPRLDMSRAEVVQRLRSSRGRKCLGCIGSIYLVAAVALNIIFEALIEALLKLIFDNCKWNFTGLRRFCQE